MSFCMFLNFEKLSIQIIEDEISKMDDSAKGMDFNTLETLNEEPFMNNLYHGCIAATFIVNLYETALNTIVGKRLGCTETDILKTSHGVKLQLICTMCGVDLLKIKGSHNYATVQSIIKVRNDITHFKDNELFVGTFISNDITLPSGTSKEALTKMFSKSYMDKCYKATIEFLELLCAECGFLLSKDCLVFDHDGRADLCEFICDKRT